MVAMEKRVRKLHPNNVYFISTNACVHFTVCLSMAAAMGDLTHRKPASTE
jgi:hypothetical protein